MDKGVKVLFIGDVRGNFKELFTRLTKTNQKAGPFAAAFCVGTFFDPANRNTQLDQFLAGKAKFPIPTYFVNN